MARALRFIFQSIVCNSSPQLRQELLACDVLGRRAGENMLNQKSQGNAEELRLLIVDDEEAARYGMRRALGGFSYDIAEAGSVDAARLVIAEHRPDLLILDVNLPGMSGMDFLRELQSKPEDAPLTIIITAHGSERMAVEAVKLGAHDYLSKPFEVDDLRLVVKNAFETVRLRRENQSLRRRIEIEGEQRGSIIGASAAIERVRCGSGRRRRRVPCRCRIRPR